MSGTWTGRINRIGTRIDDRTQTVPAFISIDGSGRNRLFEGSFLRAEIPGEIIENAIAIPRRAVYEEKFAYIIKNGKFDYRPVDITFEDTESYIVNQGLANGDTLVLELLQGVAPGMPAQTKDAVPGERSDS